MISLQSYFARQGVPITGYDKKLELDATDLLLRVDAALAIYNADTGGAVVPMVSSGFRTPAINASIAGAAKNSLHMQAKAIDLADPRGSMGAYFMAKKGQQLLKKVGLWLEAPSKTIGWVHLQSEPQKSYAKTGLHWFLP